jgi:predicted TIM-barrel fold metal-dependent hydrolase
MECGSSYRPDGPEELRPVGEVEFANRIAEQSVVRGKFRACAGIVGHADFLLGDAVARTLEAEVSAAPERFKGVRHMAAHDADPAVLGPTGHAPANMLASDTFRAGFAHLPRLGLSFDAWVLEPQLKDVTSLAQSFPQTSIVLDHTGAPLGIASYDGRLAERFPTWRSSMRDLARCPKVVVKLGGLGNALSGSVRGENVSSAELAVAWKPYVLECIEAFGAGRCMFESNYPVDSWAADYSTLWNAFKRITARFSATEKAALYSGTAARVYRLDMPSP